MMLGYRGMGLSVGSMICGWDKQVNWVLWIYEYVVLTVCTLHLHTLFLNNSHETDPHIDPYLLVKTSTKSTYNKKEVGCRLG